MTIAVDLDGTLAEYHGWKGPDHIGEPIEPMMRRVKRWVEEGHDVVIFTARIHNDSDAYHAVGQWLIRHGLGELKVTNVKTPDIHEFWDDRCFRVQKNKGVLTVNQVEELPHGRY